MVMKRLNLPMAPLKLTKSGDAIYVHCLVRKKKMLLTPEEWVRQHAIYFLIAYKEVPEGMIATELGMKINKLKRRSDIVVYGRDKSFLLLIECKAPEVQINDKVLHQAAQYNSHIKAKYIWLTNGLDHHLYQINHQTGEIKRLEELAKYKEL